MPSLQSVKFVSMSGPNLTNNDEYGIHILFPFLLAVGLDDSHIVVIIIPCGCAGDIS
jgi:hypothetical protein